MISLPLFLQCDPRWGPRSLGGSALTLCSDGCTVCSLTMALWNWGVRLTPLEVEARLSAAGAFEAGKVVWTRIQAAFPEVWFHYRWDTTNLPEGRHQKLTPDAALEKANRLVELGQPVILNVMAGRHFVVAYGRDPLAIMDPVYAASPVTYQSRYGDPLKTLCGIVALIGPPVEADGDARTANGFAGGVKLIDDLTKKRLFIDLFL